MKTKTNRSPFKFWALTQWPFDPSVGLVWAKRFNRGTVYLMDNQHHDFTCSFGHNSGDSYSGCFYGHAFQPDYLPTVVQAMELLDRKVTEDLNSYWP